MAWHRLEHFVGRVQGELIRLECNARIQRGERLQSSKFVSHSDPTKFVEIQTALSYAHDGRWMVRLESPLIPDSQERGYIMEQSPLVVATLIAGLFR